MKEIGIMPCLDMKEGRVVKGIHFVDLKDAGDPVENASFYQAEGADELAMLDIAATLENRKTRLQWVKAVSSVIQIPLTVGGGIGSLEDIEMVLGAGASKVSMNSAAVKNPDLIKTGAERFGREKITVAIDGRRNKEMPSGFEVVIAGGKDLPGLRGRCVAADEHGRRRNPDGLRPGIHQGDSGCNGFARRRFGWGRDAGALP